MLKEKYLSSLFVIALTVIASACSEAPDPDSDGNAPPPQSSAPAPSKSSFGIDASHPPLSNKAGPYDLDAVAEKGGTVVIRPTALNREVRSEIPSQKTHTDNNVCAQTKDACVATQPVFQNQCSNSCSVCFQWGIFGPHPGICCNPVCRNVQVGQQCTRTEAQCIKQVNQWEDLTTYQGLSDPTTTQDTQPMKSAAILTAGMKLRFSLTGGQVVECGLDQFKPKVEADKIAIQLGNVTGCPPIFSDGAKSPTELSLVNAIDVSFSYQQGRSVKTWDNRSLEEPVKSVYSPEVEFVGTVTVYPAGVAVN